MEDARQRQAAVEEQARLREVRHPCWLSAAVLFCGAPLWASAAVHAAQDPLQGCLPTCTLLSAFL